MWLASWRTVACTDDDTTCYATADREAPDVAEGMMVTLSSGSFDGPVTTPQMILDLECSAPGHCVGAGARFTQDFFPIVGSVVTFDGGDVTVRDIVVRIVSDTSVPFTATPVRS